MSDDIGAFGITEYRRLSRTPTRTKRLNDTERGLPRWQYAHTVEAYWWKPGDGDDAADATWMDLTTGELP